MIASIHHRAADRFWLHLLIWPALSGWILLACYLLGSELPWTSSRWAQTSLSLTAWIAVAVFFAFAFGRIEGAAKSIVRTFSGRSERDVEELAKKVANILFIWNAPLVLFLLGPLIFAA